VLWVKNKDGRKLNEFKLGAPNCYFPQEKRQYVKQNKNKNKADRRRINEIFFVVLTFLTENDVLSMLCPFGQQQ
jgi:hypothetical protein